MQNNILTLFSSDSTIQYTKDIFSVLSLPRECIFQFRYQSQHVENSVKSFFQIEEKAIGCRVLIAFRSNSSCEDEKEFIIPIRWAEITSVKLFSDVYSVFFKLMGYPTFTQDYKNTVSCFEQINTYSKNFFQRHDKVIAVHPFPLDAVELRDEKERDDENWRSIVEAMTKIPTYNNSYFLKSSPLYIEKHDSKKQIVKKNCSMVSGRFVLVEGQCINVDIEYYSANYNRAKKQQIEVLVDDNVIRKVKGLRRIFQSRYGCFTLGFQSQKNTNNTFSEICMYTVDDLENNNSQYDEIQTDIVFPVITQKNKSYKIKKSLIMFLGASLVALPGILGDAIDITWNIVLAIGGALVLGINNYWESKE